MASQSAAGLCYKYQHDQARPAGTCNISQHGPPSLARSRVDGQPGFARSSVRLLVGLDWHRETPTEAVRPRPGRS